MPFLKAVGQNLQSLVQHVLKRQTPTDEVDPTTIILPEQSPIVNIVVTKQALLVHFVLFVLHLVGTAFLIREVIRLSKDNTVPKAQEWDERCHAIAAIKCNKKEGNGKEKKKTPESVGILEASTFGVVCATMIYLFVELRLLAATGYASIPFEQLAVDSDEYCGRFPFGGSKIV